MDQANLFCYVVECPFTNYPGAPAGDVKLGVVHTFAAAAALAAAATDDPLNRASWTTVRAM